MDKIVVLLIYVDNMISRNNSSLINELKDVLRNSFKIKNLGELKYFIGIEVA